MRQTGEQTDERVAKTCNAAYTYLEKFNILFIIITLLRTIKSMIITPEIKITCTCQVLVFIMVLRQ